MTPAALDLVAVGHAHAAHATVADEDLLDAGVGEHLAAGGADARDDRVGDAPGAAHGIEAAVQVVLGDQRLDDERRALGRQPHVAPLAGEDGDEVRIVGQLRQHLPRRALEAVRQAAAQPRSGDGSRPGRQRAFEREGAHAARHFAQQFEVAVDRPRLVREVAEEVVPERLAAGHGVVDLVADEEAVVVRVHRRPGELALREEVHHPAQRGPGTHVADVVHADVPLVAGALVAVGGAAGRVVLLEHRDALAEFRQQRRCREPADARADDDACRRDRSVGMGGSADRCAGCWAWPPSELNSGSLALETAATDFIDHHQPRLWRAECGTHREAACTELPMVLIRFRTKQSRLGLKAESSTMAEPCI